MTENVSKTTNRDHICFKCRACMTQKLNQRDGRYYWVCPNFSKGCFHTILVDVQPEISTKHVMRSTLRTREPYVETYFDIYEAGIEWIKNVEMFDE